MADVKNAPRKVRSQDADLSKSIRSVHTMSLGPMLALASIGFGAYRGWPTGLTLFVAVVVEIVRRLLWAAYPDFMAKIETDPTHKG